MEWRLWLQNPHFLTLFLATALGVSGGGTGLTSGTPGGILGFTAPTTLASSGVLNAGALVLGGGSGFMPLTPVSLGTTTTLLHGNSAGNPSWGPVDLTADVVNILPVPHGGTGIAAGTNGGILGFTASTTIASSGLLTANALMLGGGIGATPSTPIGLGTSTTVLHGNAAGVPSWGAVSLTADVSGNLPVTNLNSGTLASSSTFWRGDGSWAVPAGLGNVSGPASAVSGNVALFDGITGTLIKDGGTLGTSAFTATATPTTLGLVIGTNVQAYNVNLTTINQALTTSSSPTFSSVTAALTGHASLDLPLMGGTLTGNLLFTDAAYDIGASGATRPRNLFLSGDITAGGSSFTTGAFSAGAQVTGPATLGATATGSIMSYEFPVLRCYVGDGSGYSFAFVKRTGSVTTPILTINDAGTLVASSTIKTADPGLGAGAWKLGQVESGIGLALNTTSYVQVMVDGTVVKLAQVL